MYTTGLLSSFLSMMLSDWLRKMSLRCYFVCSNMYICGYKIRVGASEHVWPVRRPIHPVHCPCIGSACVDIQPSPKMDVLVDHTAGAAR